MIKWVRNIPEFFCSVLVNDEFVLFKSLRTTLENHIRIINRKLFGKWFENPFTHDYRIHQNLYRN